MQVIGEYVDRLVTVEMRPRNVPVRGIIRQLYESARGKSGERPLTLLAAEKIMERVRKNDNVFISTGVGCLPRFPHGETDGPLGAASLARSISLGLEAKPLFVVGELDIDPVTHTAKAAGINIEEYDIVKGTRNTGAIIPFPYEDEEAKKAAKELIDKYDPKALFTLETLGPNRRGIIHSALGFDMTSGLPKLHHLFEEASKRGILTIAGIDCGNELGSGVIEDEVRRVTPYGDVCQCPCRSGNACVTKADITIPASTSNWAGYGISAMLSFLLKKPDLLQDPDTERRMLEACIMAGGVDGMTLRPIMMVDGTSDKTNQALVTMLHTIIENGLIEEELKRAKEGV